MASPERPGAGGPGKANTADDWGEPLEGLSRLLRDDSPAAEDLRVEVIKRVYTYELMNNNPQFKRFGTSALPASDASQRPPPTGPLAPLKSAWYSWVDWPMRVKLFDLFESPESGRLAACISIVILLAVLTNAVTFCLETVPSIERDPDTMHSLDIVDWVCMGIFTVDFLVRFCCCPDLLAFCKSPLNIIDFLAIAPFYIELIVVAADPSSDATMSQTRILRLFRLLRVLRLIRIWSRFQNVVVVVDALSSSMDVLGMLAFLLLIILVVFGTIIYYIDNTSSSTPFDSIPQTMYYIQTTLTTTGYGDMVPFTYAAKAVAGVLMLFAIVTLALPISVIGANFTNMWMDFSALQTAAKRASKVWPNFKDLVGSLDRHRSALLDMMAHLKAGQTSVETDIAALRELLRTARALYTARVQEGCSEGWEEDVQELRECVEEMRGRLTSVRQHWDELEALLTVSEYMRSDEFLLKLDRMHLAFKNLRKWFEEGVIVVKEVKVLASDVELLKKAMQASPSTGGASATGGPEPSAASFITGANLGSAHAAQAQGVPGGVKAAL